MRVYTDAIATARSHATEIAHVAPLSQMWLVPYAHGGAVRVNGSHGNPLGRLAAVFVDAELAMQWTLIRNKQEGRIACRRVMDGDSGVTRCTAGIGCGHVKALILNRDRCVAFDLMEDLSGGSYRQGYRVARSHHLCVKAQNILRITPRIWVGVNHL